MAAIQSQREKYQFDEATTFTKDIPDSKAHAANMGPTVPRWAPCWPHELFLLSGMAMFQCFCMGVID